MEEITKNCLETSVLENEVNEPESNANSPPKIIKKMFVLDPGKLKALGLDAKIKSALAKKKKVVTKKDLIKPEQPTTSTNFMEKKFPDKNKEIKIISDVNLDDPIKIDLLSTNSQSTNLIKGFSETNTILPKTEIISEDIVDPLKSSNLYRVLPESSKPQNMIYKTTDKNNKETVYKIYLTSISKKSANNNDSPTKSSPEKPDLTVKKSIQNQPDLQKKIIENFNKVFANTPVKFNETDNTDKNTKTSTPNCVIYKSQGGTLTPIKMVCKTPRVSSVKIISNNSPEIKNHKSFSKIDISKLKAKLNENLRKMSGTTPERRIIEKSPISLVKVEHNKSPKTSIENVPSDAMNRLNEYLKKIQEEKRLNKTPKKPIAAISGISIIQKSEPSVAESSKSHKSPKYPYPIKLKEKTIPVTKNKLKMRGLEISYDGEQFYGYMQKTIKESNLRTFAKLKMMKSLLKENQKELMETEWKVKIDKELNIAPRIKVNKDSKTYSRLPKKILSPSKIENEDSDFDFNDMPFENIDCNVVEYSNDNLIDQKDISIVIQSNNIVVDDTKFGTNEESHKNQLEVIEVIDSKIIKSNEEDSVSAQVCEEEITVKSIIIENDNKPLSPNSICDEKIFVNKIKEILEPEKVCDKLNSEPNTSKKSFKQMDIRNCFQKSLKKKIPPPQLYIKSPNLEVKEKIIEDTNQEKISINEDEATITKFVANIFSRCEALEAQNDPNEPSSPLDEIITKFVYDIFTKIESLEVPGNNLQIKKSAENIVVEKTKSPLRRSRRITEGKISLEDISAVEQSLVDLGMLDETNNSLNASEDIIVEENLKVDDSKVEIQKRAGKTKSLVADENAEDISVKEINDKKMNANVDTKEDFAIKDNKVLKIDENTVQFLSKDEIKKGSIKFQNLPILKRLSRKANMSKEAISRAGKSVKSDEINVKNDTKVDMIEEVQIEETKIYKKDSGIVLSLESFNEDEEIVKSLKVSEKDNETTPDVLCHKISSRSRSRSLRNKSSVEEEPHESPLSDKTSKRITRKSENNESHSNAEMNQKLSPNYVLRKSTSKEKLISLPIKESNKKTSMTISKNLKNSEGSKTEMESIETETENSLNPKTSKKTSRTPINPVISTRSLRKSGVSEKASEKEQIIPRVVDSQSEEVDKNDCLKKTSKKFLRKPLILEKSSRSLRNVVISVPLEETLEDHSQNVIKNTEISVAKPIESELPVTLDQEKTFPTNSPEVKEQILSEIPDSKSERLDKIEVEPKSSKRISRKPITSEKSLRTLRKSKIFVPVQDNLEVPRPIVLEPDITKETVPDSEEQVPQISLTFMTEPEQIEKSSSLNVISIKPLVNLVENKLENLQPTEVSAHCLEEVVIQKHSKRVSRKPIILSKSSRSLGKSVSSIPKEGISVSKVDIAPIATEPVKLQEEKPKPLKRTARKPIITEKSSRSLRKSSSGTSEINVDVDKKIVQEVLPASLQESEISVDFKSHGEKLEELEVSASAIIQEVLPNPEKDFVVSEIQEKIYTNDESSPKFKENEIINASHESSEVKKKSSKRNSRKPIIPETNTRFLRKTVVPVPKQMILETEETVPIETIIQITKKTGPILSRIESSKEDSVSDLKVNFSEIEEKMEEVLITESVPSSFGVIKEFLSQPQPPDLKTPSSAQIVTDIVTKSNEIKSSKRNTRKAIIPEKTLRSLRKSGKESNNEIPESEKKSEISEVSKNVECYSNVIEQTPVSDVKNSETYQVLETPANNSDQNEEYSATKKLARKVGQKKQIQKEIKDKTDNIQLAQLTLTTSKRSSRKSIVVYKDNSDESETEVCRTRKKKPKKDDTVINQPKRRATRLSTASSISDRRENTENDEEFNRVVEGDEKQVVETHGKRGRSLSSVKEENVDEVPKKKRAYNKKGTNAVLEVESSNGSKKRERTSGNSDDLNESKKQKTSHIICGKCMETIPRVSWKRHLLGHNGIGWIVGEEPDWDLNEKNLILYRMLAFIKEYGLSFVTCEKCGATRKSALGLITHQEECGLDAEALEKKKITCEYCGSRLKAYCLPIHLQNHCYELKRREREAKKLKDEKDAEESKANNESVLVTESGRIKRRSVLKAENIIKSTTLSEAKSLCEDYIGVFQRKKITGGCTRRWAAQIRENETAKCLNDKCSYTGKTVNDLLVHSKLCNFTDNASGYICLICKIRDSTRELIKSHIEKVHGDVNEQTVAVDYDASDSEADIGDESSESDDDESGDEEIDEEPGAEDDILEEDDEVEVEVESKGRKQKLYAVPQNILENLEESKAMMVDYKTILVNGKRTPFFSFAIDWTNDFRKLHYAIEPLYREIAIQQFKILTSAESKDFLPLVEKSPNFYAKISDKYRSKYCNSKPPPEWQNLETFQGTSLGGVPTFYCGGPIIAMDWVPFPNTYKGPEVLAVVVKNDIHNATAIFELQPEKCIIQIWDIPDVTNSVLRISSTPKMRYAICFPYGPVWQIKFCPSGGYFDDGTSESRLGLLAVTSLIGDVYLYALPIRVNLTQEEDEHFSILSLKPSAILTYDLNKYKLIGEKSQQMTKITWSEAKGHSVFAAGYSSGMICVWKIDTKSILLLQRINDVKTFLPIQIIKAHNNCISALSIFYVDNSRYMMTGCKDRSSKFYDIQSVPVELTCNQLKSRITCGAWPLHWPGFFLSVDEGYALHRAGTSYVQPLDIGSKQTSMHILNSTACDMDFNDWLNSFVVVTDNGDIVGGYCKQLLFTFSEKDARKCRFIFGCTEVVELKNAENPILNSESSYPNKYGLIFCDILDPINSKQCSVDLLNTRRPPIEEYPLTQINQVRCNRNADAYKFYALGYQAGFVRIRSLRQVK